MASLKEWVTKERDTAEHRNEVIRYVNNNLPISVSEGLTATTGANGTAMSIDRSPRGRHAITIGKIVAAGPNAEADYTDHRYWVQLLRNKVNAANYKDGQVLDLEAIDPARYNAGRPVIVTAYDALDFEDGAHDKEVDTFVYLAPINIDEPTAADIKTKTRWYILGGAGGGGPEGIGTEQFQCHQMLTANTDGWDWLLSHP